VVGVFYVCKKKFAFSTSTRETSTNALTNSIPPIYRYYHPPLQARLGAKKHLSFSHAVEARSKKMLQLRGFVGASDKASCVGPQGAWRLAGDLTIQRRARVGTSCGCCRAQKHRA
jgi:hypothetical protein